MSLGQTRRTHRARLPPFYVMFGVSLRRADAALNNRKCRTAFRELIEAEGMKAIWAAHYIAAGGDAGAFNRDPYDDKMFARRSRHADRLMRRFLSQCLPRGSGGRP